MSIFSIKKCQSAENDGVINQQQGKGDDKEVEDDYQVAVYYLCLASKLVDFTQQNPL